MLQIFQKAVNLGLGKYPNFSNTPLSEPEISLEFQTKNLVHFLQNPKSTRMIISRLIFQIQKLSKIFQILIIENQN